MKLTVDTVQDIEPDCDLSDVAVVFPAYNEERRVQQAIEVALGVEEGALARFGNTSTWLRKGTAPNIGRSHMGSA